MKTFSLLIITIISAASSSCNGNSGSDLKNFEAFNQYEKHLDSLIGQSIDNETTSSVSIDNINGLRQEGFDFFNAEGYNIDLETMNKKMDEKTISEIKSKYSILSEKTVVDTIRENYICYSLQEIHDSMIISSIYYLIGVEEKTKVVTFRTFLNRDINFELGFNELVIHDSIPNDCFSNMQVDSIKFAGRRIPLGSVCTWQGINNIQCSHRGQMNWSEFQTQNRAIEMIRNQINLSKADNDIEKVEYIDVLFEGNKTKALKMYYKINLPKMLLGGSNIIIAYYVVSPVRNRFVGCILSHYDDDAKEGELPILLSEVMKLVEN